MKKVLTYAEVADLLGVCEKTVQQWKKTGALPFVQLTPRRVGFREEDVDEFLELRLKRVGGDV